MFFLIFMIGLAESVPEKCQLPLESGMCLAYFEKYGYNTTTGQCQMFVYGGCPGNDNRFDTMEECQKECPSESDDVCSLPLVTGRCRAYIKKYGFNTTTGQCELFIYGGCGGNANSFDTLEDCQKRCPGKASNVCDLPIITGPCKAYMPSYGFNSKTGKCEFFVYGGCQGNDNRFTTEEECEKKCSERC